MSKEFDDDILPVPVLSFPNSIPIDPYGKKKGKQSWQAIAKEVGGMTIEQIKEKYTHILNQLPDVPAITLRELAILHAYVSTIGNPSPSMLAFLRESEEGKLPATFFSASGNISDWREQVKLMQQEGMDISEADVIAEAKIILEQDVKLLKETNEVHTEAGDSGT